MTEYTGKRVVVTGCSSGIGLATARALVDHGAEVIGMSRRTPEVGIAAFHMVDFASADSVEAATAGIEGRIDALFNCAGAPPLLPSAELVTVNFLGPRLLTERALEHMADGGAIVNISSSVASAWRARVPLLQDFLATESFADGVRWWEANESIAGHGYLFSKEAVAAWTMQESASLIRRGIRMNVISPGAVQTPLLHMAATAFPADLLAANEQPIGRPSSVEEQVSPLLFLNGARASYVNGAELATDGGYQASHLMSATR